VKKNSSYLSTENILTLCGLLIVGYAIFLFVISSHFTYAANPSLDNTIKYVFIRILVGLIYIVAVIIFLKNISISKKKVWFVIIVGIISRIILVPTVPILEDDFNRYLWDGAVTANGYNPYKYAPKDLFNPSQSSGNTTTELYSLGKESGKVIKRINHPHIRTIYPPVAQGVFVLTYIIKPWSVPLWKTIILFLDILVLVLLFILIKKLGLNRNLIIIYWWNPILLHEFYSAGHMDIIMYPLILGAIIFYIDKKFIAASNLFALSFGVKVWPIVFIPFVLKRIFKDKRKFLLAITSSGLIILLLAFPVILTKLDDSLGFVTYSKNWTNNEAFFQLVNVMVKSAIKFLDIHYYCSLCATRWLILLGYFTFIIYLLNKKIDNNRQFVYLLFLTVSVLYLISPTQFPWYYTWILPLLVVIPRLSFVLYAAFLPLYQLKYYYPFLVWVEHIPIILFFILELQNKKIANFLEVKKLAK
jgi:hypothetical protein